MEKLSKFWVVRTRIFTLKVGEDNFVVVAAGEQVVGAGGEADGADVRGVWLEALHAASAPDVVENARRVLVSRNQQPARGVNTYGGNRRALQKLQTSYK